MHNWGGGNIDTQKRVGGEGRGSNLERDNGPVVQRLCRSQHRPVEADVPRLLWRSGRWGRGSARPKSLVSLLIVAGVKWQSVCCISKGNKLKAHGSDVGPPEQPAFGAGVGREGASSLCFPASPASPWALLVPWTPFSPSTQRGDGLTEKSTPPERNPLSQGSGQNSVQIRIDPCFFQRLQT